jgi:hypothetical protein
LRSRAGELQGKQQQLEQLEQQRLSAERDTSRYAQALAQEKQNLQALEAQIAPARQRVHDGEQRLNHLKSCAPASISAARLQRVRGRVVCVAPWQRAVAECCIAWEWSELPGRRVTTRESLSPDTALECVHPLAQAGERDHQQDPPDGRQGVADGAAARA